VFLIKDPTEEQYIDLVKKYPNVLSKLKFQTNEICRVALENGADLALVEPEFITDELEIIALNNNPENIFNVKSELKTYERYLALINKLLMAAVSKNGCLLELIPAKKPLVMELLT